MSAVLLMHLANLYTMTLDGLAARMIDWCITTQIYIGSTGNILLKVNIFLATKVVLFALNRAVWLISCKTCNNKHHCLAFSNQNLNRFPSWEWKQWVKWNQQHSRVWITVEHTFGALKGKFPTLKLLTWCNMKHIYLSIEALVIIHNIFVDMKDSLRTYVTMMSLIWMHRKWARGWIHGQNHTMA